METVLIAAGTGLIGKKLISVFNQNGYKVHILSRRMLRKKDATYFPWDLNNKYIDDNAFENVTHIINLAGANIGSKRWTKSRKKEILESRVQSTNLLFEFVTKLNIPLKTFITSSAVGYYGSITSEKIFIENDLPGNDFLGNVCLDWEKASHQFENAGTRTLQIRTGVVFDKNEGAMPKMLTPLKMGFGSVLGTGKQYIPWIHIDDISQIYLFALKNEKINGAYNAVAPQHTNNAYFTTFLAQSIGKKIWLPAIPEFVLKILLGEMSDLVLKGSRVSSKKIQNAGFEFQFDTIEKATNDLI